MGIAYLCLAVVYLLHSVWSAAFFSELRESEVGLGWLGEGVQWPLPALPAVSVPPHLFFCLFFFFLMNVSICMAVLCSGRVHPSSEPPSTATPRQITNPICMASPQQMRLSEASAVDLLSSLACTLHSSQRNPGFLLTCQAKLDHSSSWASCLWGPISGNRHDPCGWVGVGRGPKLNEFGGTGLFLPPNICIWVNLMKKLSRTASLDGIVSIHIRHSSDKAGVLKEVSQRKMSSRRDKKKRINGGK